MEEATLEEANKDGTETYLSSTESAMENAAEGEIVAFADLPGLALDLEGFLNLIEKLSIVATSSLYTFTRDLSVAMIGPDVKALQKFLNANGFIIAKAGTGSLGPVTRDYINSIR